MMQFIRKVPEKSDEYHPRANNNQQSNSQKQALKPENTKKRLTCPKCHYKFSVDTKKFSKIACPWCSVPIE